MPTQEIRQGDRVQHTRTRTEATVLTASPDGTLLVLLDRHRGIPTWSVADVKKIGTVPAAHGPGATKPATKSKK